jgi:hypothetical protein
MEKQIADLMASNAKRNADAEVPVFSGSAASPVVQTPSSSCGSHGSRVVCSCHHSGGHSSVCRSSGGNSSSSGSSAAVRFQRMMNWAEQISMQDALAAKSKELIIARAAIAGEDVTFE